MNAAQTQAVCCCGCHHANHPRAVWRVTAMCIHEHLAVLDFCARCFNEEQIGRGPSPGWCGDCFDEQYAEDPGTGVCMSVGTGPLSHDCALGPPVTERLAA